MNAVAPLKEQIERSFTDQIAVAVEKAKALAQVECPVVHHFAPGVYLREIFMPADTIVIGKVHKTEHFNILIQGACLIVNADGSREELRAPCVFVSKPNVQKVLYILEDMRWQTVHVSSETDLAKLEAELIAPEHPELTDDARYECDRIRYQRQLESLK